MFFASNQGLGIFEIPLDDIFLYDCRNHWCPAIAIELIGDSETTGNNDGLYCWGGPNPWKSKAKPFDCTRVAGIMKAKAHDTGYDIMSISLGSGASSSLFNIPFDRTDPPYTSISSISLNPKDNIFYGVMTVGALPYLVRFDEDKVEFVAKLPFSAGGYVGGSFTAEGHYVYSSLITPPVRFRFESVNNYNGYISQLDPNLLDKSDAEAATVQDAKNATPTGMSGLVTVNNNFESDGNEQEYIIGIDDNNNLVVSKENCSHQLTWLIPTSSTAGHSFGPAYTFDGKIYFEAKDGSGIYAVPLDGLNVNEASSITLRMAGTSQESGGTDFAGWTDEGFNCMTSPTPFYSGDCQLSYHEVDAEADGTCPEGSIEI